MDVRDAFEDFGGKVWLNAAHQGPLPRVAAEAAREAVGWKLRPYELTAERFAGVPARLKERLARLVGAPAGEIILANGASYGIHLLANGLPLEAGDEVLLMKGDFPANLYPWLALRERGVQVTLLEPQGKVLTPDEIAAAVTPRTRALLLTWVHSLSGYAIDLEAIGEVCRRRGVWFLVNATQALGLRTLEVTRAPVDAVVCSCWKWLLGPYATGFAWIRPSLLERLRVNQAYWLNLSGQAALAGVTEPELPSRLEASRFDVFGTANFFNFRPLSAAVGLILDLGPSRMHEHAQSLVQRLVDGLDRSRFRLLSPEEGPARSALVFFSHRDPDQNALLYQRLVDAGVHVAHRAGALRVSPHVYNTRADIDRLLSVLQKEDL